MNRELKREKLETIRIGSLCSDCTNPYEKVMTSYVFDLDNIISLGMFEKARISAEVLVEQDGDPIEIMKNTVFPKTDEMLTKYKEKKINKIELVKSLQAADTAAEVLKTAAGDRWKESEVSGWNKYLEDILRDSCGII
ncbi:MAG: hypothetical protein Q4C14_03780 [Bacillota bacterium]|nr:hypothetical protein [Bacillota bacterium]